MARSDEEIIELAEAFSTATPAERKALLKVWMIEAKKVVLSELPA